MNAYKYVRGKYEYLCVDGDGNRSMSIEYTTTQTRGGGGEELNEWE